MNNSEKIIEICEDVMAKYVSFRVAPHVLKELEIKLNIALNNYLSEHRVWSDEFPIGFKNEYGEFWLESDGELRWIPTTATQKITTDITILKTGDIVNNSILPDHDS